MNFLWFLAIWPIIFDLMASEPNPKIIPIVSPTITPTMSTTPTPTPTPAPMRLYKTSLSPVAKHYQTLSDKSSPEAKKLAYIANQPYPIWLSQMSDISRLAVHIQSAGSQNSLPVVVAYFIPYRNCAPNTDQGAKSSDEYRSFVNKILDTIGNNEVILIIEPDAVAGWNCLSGARRQQRIDLLNYFSTQLAGRNNIFAYMDAGHPRWMATDEAISRLKSVGIQKLRGFSLNVANFVTTADNNRYGVVIAERLGKKFVIDTSRNGNGPTSDYQWCNPRGRSVGEKPFFAPSDQLRDGYLWIKPPGESDGNCNGGPNAGEFWPEYAIELAAAIK